MRQDNYLSEPADLKAMKNLPQRYYVECDASQSVPVDTMSTTSSLDWSALDRLKTEMGHDNQEMVDEIVELFLEDTARQIKELRIAVTNSDTGAIRSIGHSLKSSCASLGALRLSELCDQLEALGKAGLSVDASNVVSKAEVEFEQVINLLTTRGN